MMAVVYKQTRDLEIEILIGVVGNHEEIPFKKKKEAHISLYV